MDLLMGIGSRVGGPRVTNYKTTSSNVLETTNLGRAVPQALVGLGFPICGSDAGPKASQEGGLCGNRFVSRTSIFVSAQFGAGTDSTLSGYTVGLGFHLGKMAHALIGFSTTPVSEPSPGFRNAAAQYVSSHASQYPGTNPSALAANSPNAFDGFQYVIPPEPGSMAQGTPIYAGDVLTTHYRGGLFIGVAFPLTLRPKFDQ